MGWIPSLQTDYQVHVEHCYPIPDDEEEERLNDLKEVESGVRSVSSYQEKWGILPGRDGEKTIEPEPADKLKEEG